MHHRSLRRLTAVALAVPALALAAPAPVYADTATPHVAALQALLTDADPTPLGLTQLRALVDEATRVPAVHVDLNDVVRQALEQQAAVDRWASELREAARGEVEDARQLTTDAGAPPVAAEDVQRLARTLGYVELRGWDQETDETVYLFVRFLLDPRLIQMLPVPSGPSVAVPTPGAHHAEYLEWRQRTLASDAVPPGPGPGGGGFHGYCDGFEYAHAWAHQVPRHWYWRGELKFCYDFQKVFNANSYVAEVETYDGFEPFVAYQLNGYLQDRGGYMSGLDANGRFVEHIGYEWNWQPIFETCFLLGKGCVMSDEPYLAVHGYHDGSTIRTQPYPAHAEGA